MAQSITCGYAISTILNGSRKYKPANVHDGIVRDFNEIFDGIGSFQVYEKPVLREKVKQYLSFITKNRHKFDRSTKDDIITLFSDSRWKQLPENDKNKHSLKDCKVIFLSTYVL